MITVLKPIKMNEDLEKTINLYKITMEKMYNAKISSNRIIEDTIILGLKPLLKSFKMMKDGTFLTPEGKNFELPEEAIEMLKVYERLLRKLEPNNDF
jgi:hypothetical protein